jgi:hypothetical protein
LPKQVLTEKSLGQPIQNIQQTSKTLKSSIAQNEEMLDMVRSAIDSGDEMGAKALYKQIRGNKPIYENLVDEVAEFRSGLFKEVEGGVAPKYGTYQKEVDKFTSFLKIAGEKKSTKTNELFREHIPASVFGTSSDEVASALGKSENEFMAELTKDLNIVGGGSRSTKVLGRIKSRIATIKSMAEALKLEPEFYKVVNSLDSQLGTIPSYKVLKPYKMTGGVSIKPTTETLAKIEARNVKAQETAFNKSFDEWQKSYKSETITGTQAVNKGLRGMQDATNESIKGKIAEETNRVFGVSIRSPEYIFEKFGRKEDLWRPLLKGQENVTNEIRGYIPKANDWFKRAGSKEDRRVIAQWLDGQDIKLSDNQLKVAQEVKSYYAEWADKIGLPVENRISDYLTHIFEPDFANNKRVFPEELSRILDYITPNKEFNPFLEKRTGAKGYKLDYLEALDAYVFRSARKLHLDQPLGMAAEFVKNMPAQASKYTDDFLRNFKNRPTGLEKAINQNIIDPLPAVIKQKLGNRPISKLLNTVMGQVYRGTIGLNITSPLRNLTQGVNTYAKLGERYTAEGYIRLFNKGSYDELVNNHVLDDMIIAEYKNSGIRGNVAKMDKALFWLFELTERINRGATYFGSKAKYLNEGINETKTIEMAKDLVRQTQFGYGKLHTPLAIQSPIGKVGFQLSTFMIKQAEFVGGMAKKKEILPLARYILSSLAVVYASKKFLSNILGMNYTDAVFKNIMPNLGPIPQYTSNFFKYATAKDESEKEYYADKLKRSGFGMFFPAGTQITKTYEGVSSVQKGYDETKKGNVKFPIEQSTKNYILGGLGGKYNLPEAQEYRKEERTPLSEKQSIIIRGVSNKSDVYNQFITNREETALVNKVKEQLSGGKNISDKAETAVYTLDGVETQGFKIGNKFVFINEDGEATSKSISTLEKRKAIYDKGLIDAQYSLSADRLKRAGDKAGWIDITQNYIDYLTEYKTTLNEKTEAKDILKIENKIGDLQASIAKTKKGKKPKKVTIKIKKAQQVKLNIPKRRRIKIARPKLTKLTSRKYSITA